MMTVTLYVTFTYIEDNNFQRTEINEQVLTKLVSELSKTPLLTAEYDELQPYIEEMVADPLVDEIVLANHKNVVVVSNNLTLIGEAMPELHNTKEAKWKTLTLSNGSGIIGAIAIKFSHKSYNDTMINSYELGLKVAALGMLIIAFVGVFIGYLMTRRLDQLTKTARQLKTGNLRVRANISGNDEIAILGKTFDEMAESIENNIEQLIDTQSQLEARVKGRTRELAMAKEEAERTNEVMSLLMNNLSREIHTPLQYLTDYAQTSLENENKIEQKSALKEIASTGKALLKILNRNLNTADYSINTLQADPTETTLHVFMSDLESVFTSRLKKHSITININYEYPIPSSLILDPFRVKLILLNIINDIADTASQATIQFTLAYNIQEQSLNILIFEKNLLEAELDSASPYYKTLNLIQLKSRNSAQQSQSFLVTQKLTNTLNGTLVRHDLEKSGFAYYLSIPAEPIGSARMLERSDMSKSRDKTNLVATKSENQVEMLVGKVLLVEDNLDIQRLITMILKRLGLEVDTCINGQLAVEAVRTHSYDLVFMDISMPVMDGKEAARLLRTRGETVPIVALTAEASRVENYQELGFDALLEKPVPHEMLKEVISRYLARKSETKISEKNLVSTMIHEDEFYREAICIFVSNLEEEVIEIMDCWHKEDLVRFKAKVHQLKGTGGNAGFPIVSQYCEEMERFLENGDYQKISVHLETLRILSWKISGNLPLYQKTG